MGDLARGKGHGEPEQDSSGRMNRVGGGCERGICEGGGGAGKDRGSGVSIGRGE